MMTVNQILADKRRMERFICDRIRTDRTRIVLADGRRPAGPAWVDLTLCLCDDGDHELVIESNEPDAFGVREVYEHFRRQERTSWEREREIQGEINRWKVHDLEWENHLVQETSMAPSSPPTELSRPAACKSTLTIGETAALLGCSYGEARKRMLEGRIRAIKDGRWIRTRPEWVEEYVTRITIQLTETPGTIHEIPVPSRRKSHVKVKVGGIGHRFLKDREKK